MSPLTQLNLVAGWIGMLLGAASGACLGFFFHRADWAGGYGSFRRRMMRLGHIAFFGLGFLNITFALTSLAHPFPDPYGSMASFALLIGAVSMPLNCFLTAWREGFRHLFAIPVTAVTLGVALVLLTWIEVLS